MTDADGDMARDLEMQAIHGHTRDVDICIITIVGQAGDGWWRLANSE